MYRYKYIALLDIDEVILPIEEKNWSDLMKNVKPLAENFASHVKYKNKSFVHVLASYNFRNVYFMDEMLEMHEKVSFWKLFCNKDLSWFKKKYSQSFLPTSNWTFPNIKIIETFST